MFASGARVFEHTQVKDLTDRKTGVTIETANGRVHAKQAVLTANAYSRDLLITPRRLGSPVWTSLVEIEPIAPERLDAIGWTSRAPIVTAHMILGSFRVTAGPKVLQQSVFCCRWGVGSVLGVGQASLGGLQDPGRGMP